jgi:hypothetical protein
MEEKKYAQGEQVIEQGTDGHDLFVVETGTLTCTKNILGKSEPLFLKKYE